MKQMYIKSTSDNFKLKHPFLELLLFREEQMQNEILKKCKFKQRWLGCNFLVWLEERVIHIYPLCASLRMYCSLKIWGTVNVLFFIGEAPRDNNFSVAYMSDTCYHLPSVGTNTEINGIDCICLDQLTIQDMKVPQISFIWMWFNLTLQEFCPALNRDSLARP